MAKKKYKIYTIEYLSNEELTEEDLFFIFDTPSLAYSLVVNMFRHAGETKKSDADIINICKTDEKWVYKNFWTKKERTSYLNKIIPVFQNVYQYSVKTARQKAEWFLFQYGLSIKGNNLLS
jgi:hypothetical protein